MAGLWWQRKGLVKSKSPSAYLLCLQAIHQWFHRYVPRQDFLSRVDNGISDLPYCYQDLMDAALLAHMDASHSLDLSLRLWNPPRNLVSAISSTLRCMTSPREYLLVNLPLTIGTGRSATSSVKAWPLTPYSSHTGIRCLSSTTLRGSTIQVTSPPEDVRYNYSWLRTPYGRLSRCLLIWGPQNPASQVKAG